MGFLESSGKPPHTIFYSGLISVMSFCKLAWKEEVVQVIQALIDQHVGRSVGRNKGLSGLWTDRLQWGWL